MTSHDGICTVLANPFRSSLLLPPSLRAPAPGARSHLVATPLQKYNRSTRQRNTMATFDTLPDELILLITECSIGDTRTLARLSRCSKRMYCIAENALSHTITIRSMSPSDYSLPLLLRTLLFRRILASRVRKLPLRTASHLLDSNGNGDPGLLSFQFDNNIFFGIGGTINALVIDAMVDKAV